MWKFFNKEIADLKAERDALLNALNSRDELIKVSRENESLRNALTNTNSDLLKARSMLAYIGGYAPGVYAKAVAAEQKRG